MNCNNRESAFNTMRTAVLTAYPKIFTDIEYSSEIFFAAAKCATEYGFSFRPSLFVSKMAVEIEARHKAMNIALDRALNGGSLVIELGAGLSPRRAQYENADYIEIDHKQISEMKARIYEEIGLSELAGGLCAVDLKETDAFSRALESAGASEHRNVIVLSEGLFWYLERRDILAVANALSVALRGVDWVWVSADCPTGDKRDASYRKVIVDSSKRGEAKPFVDFEEFRDFFVECGFSVERNKLTDFVMPKEIYSGKFFSVSERQVAQRMNNYTDIALLKKKA